MFRIKICGITSVKDAQLAALAGGDAIGLNFYDKSSRCVELATAEQMIKVVAGKAAKVGVFVNAPQDEVTQLADRLQLEYLQLHGDEPPDYLAGLPAKNVIRAFRFGDQGVQPIREYLDACRQLACLPAAILIDADAGDSYGGTGAVADWQKLSEQRQELGEIPLVLAGGLTPFNVGDAIGRVRPDAVDVASGVEAEPGKKDLLLVRAFCTAARKAFQQLGTG